ncbi:hypothetical protein M3589_17870 [Heyndrickxia oleronia]|uniref:hypothetical protein n=1 Tax=Heyndrickxia oleronia TaxID=38875 RepID=UPI00203CA1D8|nr:hypothetical protein [Heyndrickxia oleronia]MCM3239571.1 hypothetical protein [Heyndrickxia oleronia]
MRHKILFSLGIFFLIFFLAWWLEALDKEEILIIDDIEPSKFIHTVNKNNNNKNIQPYSFKPREYIVIKKK